MLIFEEPRATTSGCRRLMAHFTVSEKLFCALRSMICEETDNLSDPEDK